MMIRSKRVLVINCTKKNIIMGIDGSKTDEALCSQSLITDSFLMPTLAIQSKLDIRHHRLTLTGNCSVDVFAFLIESGGCQEYVIVQLN